MPAIAPIVIGAQCPFQLSDSETYSVDILGPVWFKLFNLQVGGKFTFPAAPTQSKYIIAGDEPFAVSVDIEFNKTPLTKLLMCLGTKIKVGFAFEGLGGAAAELDLYAEIVTVQDQYTYTVTYNGVPEKDGLTTGLYEIAAVADIGPVVNKCQTPVFGHGYIEKMLLEVYPKDEDIRS